MYLVPNCKCMYENPIRLSCTQTIKCNVSTKIKFTSQLNYTVKPESFVVNDLFKKLNTEIAIGSKVKYDNIYLFISMKARKGLLLINW